MTREIGSEFALNDKNKFAKDSLFDFLSDFTLFESGRAALRAVLAEIVQLKDKKLKALLPAYICESVVEPFVDYHFDVFFYSAINTKDSCLIELVHKYDIDVVFHLDYFGVNQWKIQSQILDAIRASGTLLVEDITHSLLFERNYQESDYYIASIRKWLGVPSGGAALSRNAIPKYKYKPNEVIELRESALKLKNDYFIQGNSDIKSEFLAKFARAEQLLDTQKNINGIDSLSIEILKKQSVNLLIDQRRENYHRLEAFFTEFLPNMIWFEPIDNQVCPIFFLVKVSSKRSELRSYLASNGVYCPIHWPIPELVKSFDMDLNQQIFECTLSIPCDQRYDSSDMAYIIELFKQFYELNPVTLVNE